MVGAELPLARATVGALLVHPLLDATLVVWRPEGGAYLDETPRPTVRGHEAWRDSPFHPMDWPGTCCVIGSTGRGRRRVPVLAHLGPRASPTISRCGPTWRRLSLGDGTSIFSSWSPAGRAASRGRHRAHPRVEPLLAVVIAAALDTATAGTLLATYLGADAAAGCSAATSSAARSR